MNTNASLGSLENKIIDVLWNNESMSTSQIIEEINKDKKNAYTTIATVLDRLNSKKLVTRKKVNGKYLYSVRISKKAYYNKIVKSFFSNFVESHGDNALASFAESIDELPPKKRDYLIKLLKSGTK